MTSNRRNPASTQSIDRRRRDLLSAAGVGIATATLSGVFPGSAATAQAQTSNVLRWGVVGTGGIANSMAPRIREAAGAVLSAVSSRRMETAREFAEEHGAPQAFDSWKAMIESDEVDAVYIATPTSVREEIGVAAANAGKHVLGEKPFANLPSLQRITAAPPPTAARIGLPSLGWIIAPPCSTAPAAPQEGDWGAGVDAFELRDSRLVFVDRERGDLEVDVDRLALFNFRTWQPERPGSFDLKAQVNGELPDALDHRRVVPAVGGQDLERDDPPHARVQSPIHGSHTAVAQLGLELVVADPTEHRFCRFLKRLVRGINEQPRTVFRSWARFRFSRAKARTDSFV